jgi:tetratricopeptide (TPR) repeat protein
MWVFLAALTSAQSAAAQATPSEESRATARAIGEEGLSYFDQGMYIDALDRFERADAIIHAPTLGLMAARSLEKLGRFVEASERYLQVTRMEIDAKSSDIWKQAIVSAGKEREALQPRIPSIEIVLEGEGAKGASVRIDGRPVPQAMVGVRTPIDPGLHRVEARGAGNATAAFERVTVAEKESARIVLTLKPVGKGALADAAPPGEGGAGVVNAGTSLTGSASATAPAPAPNTMGLGGGNEKSGESEAQKRAAARAIGEEGLTFYDQGRYVDALDRFDRADNLVQAPTLGLMAARSLEKLGRLVEASERYRHVAQMKVNANALEVFKQAQQAAAKEGDALEPRIPKVDVSVQGPGAAEVSTVLLDGRGVSPSLLGSARPISATVPADPGDHRFEAKASAGEAFERVTLAEGDKARVVLTLSASPNKNLLPSGQAAKPEVAASGGSGDEKSSPRPERRGDTQRTIGWVSIGVGAAGLATGIIAGSVAAAKREDFSGMCDEQERICPRSVEGDVGTYNTLRPVSTVGFVIGGVGLATGIVLLATLPRGGARYSSGKVQVTPWVGPASAGLRGTF